MHLCSTGNPVPRKTPGLDTGVGIRVPNPTSILSRALCSERTVANMVRSQTPTMGLPCAATEALRCNNMPTMS